VSRLFPTTPKTGRFLGGRESRESESGEDRHERPLEDRDGDHNRDDVEGIEQINGAIRLSGFDWDYGGTVIHAARDRSRAGVETPEGIRGRTLLLRLSPDASRQGSREYSEVKGDKPFRSDHPSMQSFEPDVYQMIVTFREE